MIGLTVAAIVVFVLYISYGVLFYGTRNSLSRLGVDWNRWLFMLMIWSVCILVLPGMFDITPEKWQPVVFFIGAGLILTGGASFTNADDTKYHIVGAVVACTGSIIWLGIVSPVLLLVPFMTTILGGADRWQLGGEVGIITAVFISLLM